jgi:cytochrome c peroxidase
MNAPDKAYVVNQIKKSSYAKLFMDVYGADAFNNVDRAYRFASEAISAYELSSAVSPFTSKFDRMLKGEAQLTGLEWKGWQLFRDPAKGNCEACHPSTGEYPLFTDYTNDNLGVPKNLSLPFYTQAAIYNPDGNKWVDPGLAGNSRLTSDFVKSLMQSAGVGYKAATFDINKYKGKIKVPTLRNIAVTGPYFHNGSFTNLRDVLRFYNTACAAGNPDKWGDAEVPDGRNCSEMGNLNLTDAEIDALLAFLHTLTDGYSGN